MASTDKTSYTIESQFPHFVRDDGPTLVAFIKAYYEWAEQANNALQVSKSLLEYQDVDTSPDKYLEYFHREIMPSVPRSVVADRKLLAKHIKDLYRSRGSEQSYRLFFRALYNEEVDFYYPGEDLLRASDGRWVEETTIRVGAPTSATVFKSGDPIVGQTSGATATIDKITPTLSSGLSVNEYYLLNIVGTFQDGEKITLAGDSTVFGTIVGEIGPLQTVTITKGGAFHQVGDIVQYVSGGGSGANGAVLTVSDTSGVRWKVNNGGSGYQVGSAVTINHGDGAESAFSVTGISSPETVVIMTETIAPVASCVLNTTDFFITGGANTAAVSNQFATANLAVTIAAACQFANATGGTISTLATSNYGYGYFPTLPSASVRDATIAPLLIPDGSGGIKGENAIISPVYVNGAIATASTIAFGDSYARADQVNVNNKTRTVSPEGFSVQAATASAGVSGIVNYPGRYIDTKGWISWNNKLQDNYYYQEYSYEIKSKQFTSSYKKFIDNLLHPAGTKLFGKVSFLSNVAPTSTSIGNRSGNSFTEFKFTKATGSISYINTHSTTTARTLVGNNTTFTSQMSSNTALLINNGLYFVNAVSSDTVLTLKQAYGDIDTNSTTPASLTSGDIYFRSSNTVNF